MHRSRPVSASIVEKCETGAMAKISPALKCFLSNLIVPDIVTRSLFQRETSAEKLSTQPIFHGNFRGKRD